MAKPINKKSRTRKPPIPTKFVWILLIALGLLAIWRPWQRTTIEVTSSADLLVVADEFSVSAQYHSRGPGRQEAVDELKAKQQNVLKGLKKLGVADEDIKTDTKNWFHERLPNWIQRTVHIFQVGVSVKANSENIGKIRKYLASTDTFGEVSVSYGLSEESTKKAEDQARKLAIEHASAKAAKIADSQDMKLGRLKTSKDGIGFRARCEERDLGCDRQYMASKEAFLTYHVTTTYWAN